MCQPSINIGLNDQVILGIRYFLSAFNKSILRILIRFLRKIKEKTKHPIKLILVYILSLFEK